MTPISCWECPHRSQDSVKWHLLKPEPNKFYQIGCALAGKEQDGSWKICFQLTGHQIERAVRLAPPDDCPLKENE